MPKIKKDTTLRYLQATMSIREWNADTADHIVKLLTQAGYPLIEMPEDHQIRIEMDFDYVPDGDHDVADERAKLATGEYGAYRLLLQRECDCGNWVTVDSLSGVVVVGSAHDAEYGTIEGIPDEYLRSCALDLILESGLVK